MLGRRLGRISVAGITILVGVIIMLIGVIIMLVGVIIAAVIDIIINVVVVVICVIIVCRRRQQTGIELAQSIDGLRIEMRIVLGHTLEKLAQSHEWRDTVDLGASTSALAALLIVCR